MTAYERIRKAYDDAQENSFYDAWGIVLNQKMIYGLTAECMERMAIHNMPMGKIDTIFGLVIIPCNLVEDNRAYIVDEMLGRTILGQF